MRNDAFYKTPFVLFLVLVLGSSAISAFDYAGDYVEKASAFISSVIAFLVISELLARSKGMSLFSRKKIKVIAFLYVVWLLFEQGYPLYIYRDQTLPEGYLLTMSLQLAFNAFVAKVLLNDRF
ncbi:MAG: hypothetical protein HRU48_17200 [Vibrio sp.]|uniref:hypothetical protein n=1 Tax=Vibrio TaxID=662 RepID=UPI001ED39AA4|nr:hypothetical protein [Vibrio sp.]NRB69080.1 hypothetical protein [Vibrio sp.]